MSLKAKTRGAGHTGRLRGKHTHGMALNGEFVPQAERKLRGSISQRAVCTPVLIFLYQEICVQHPEQRRAVLCLGGEDEQPAVSSILQTSCCWRKKRFWWGRRPLSSKSRQWPSCLRHHRVLQKQKPGREAQAASGVCSSGTAFQEMALRNAVMPSCSLQQGSGRRRDGPRNHPSPPALWWACFILLPLGLLRSESPQRQKFNGQSSGRRNAARHGKFGLSGNGDTGCDAGARSDEFTAAPRVGRHMIKNA